MSHLSTADAIAARSTKERVSIALLADVGRVVEVVNSNIRHAPAAMWAAQKIFHGHMNVATCDLFQWYFKALDLLEQRRFSDAAQHCDLLPLVIAYPLAFTLKQSERLVIPVAAGQHDIGLPQLERPLPLPSNGSSVIVTAEKVCVPPVDFTWQELLSEARFDHEGITFLFAGLGLRTAVADQGDQRNSGVRGGIRLEPIPQVELMREGTRIRKMSAAMKILRSVWPELYGEVNVSTDAYVLLRGPLLVGGTDFRYASITFLNMNPDWSEIAYLDHIVHEGTHNMLFFANELEPLLENPRDESPSPIRRTARPIIGTVHATMVFMRLVGLFERALEHRDLAQHTQEIEGRLHRHALGLIAGVQLIEDTAILTRRGADWLHGLRLKADLIKRELQPDAEKAARVGDDYDPLDTSSASREAADLGRSE